MGLSVCWFVCLFVGLFVCLLVCLSVGLLVCLSVCLLVCLTVCVCLRVLESTYTSDSPTCVCQELKICASIINMFHLIPAASSKLIDPLLQLVLMAEKALMLEVSVRSRFG